MVTVPSTFASELALISLVESFKERASMPKGNITPIVILPPLPCSALARISLFPSGKAKIKLVSMLMLPPVALFKASAEIELLFLKVISSQFLN
jgi:hypothetical protein